MEILRGPATKIALIQSKVNQDQKDDNLHHAVDMVLEAIKEGAKIICLPENFATGVNFPSIRRMAEEDSDSMILKTLQSLAKTHSVYLIFSMLEKDNKDCYDTAYIINSKGTIIGKYRRYALLHEELEYFSQGSIGHVIKTEYGNIGLLLGYDIRFPLICQNYFEENVTLIVCLSNNVSDYSYQLESICRARAADNICYFVYLNCLGLHKYLNKSFIGNSMIIDGSVESLDSPDNADIIARADSSETILYGDLYMRKMVRYKKKATTRYLNDYIEFTSVAKSKEDK